MASASPVETGSPRKNLVDYFDMIEEEADEGDEDDDDEDDDDDDDGGGMYTQFFDPDEETIEEFLAACPPSVENHDVAWIYVENQVQHEPKENSTADENHENIGKQERDDGEGHDRTLKFDDLPPRLKSRIYFQHMLAISKENVTAESIKKIAVKFGYVNGKWVIMQPSAEIDLTWSRVAKATAEGRLGPACKVNPRGHIGAGPSDIGGDHHVLCVYTHDFTDMDDVRRVEQVLRKELHVTGILRYKPDIYTILGIYRGNKYGIKPSIYVSSGKHGEDIVESKAEGSNQIQFDSKKESLDSFLKAHRASDNKARLTVETKSEHDDDDDDDDDDGNVDDDKEATIFQACFLFNKLLRSKELITHENIKDIAVQCGYKSGAWIISRAAPAMNFLWKKVAMATYNGELGTRCELGPRRQDSNTMVLNVGTRDFTDKEDVFRVEKLLREKFGVAEGFHYKPNIYRTFGIFRGNEYRIRPSIYHSLNTVTMNFNRREKKP